MQSMKDVATPTRYSKLQGKGYNLRTLKHLHMHAGSCEKYH